MYGPHLSLVESCVNRRKRVTVQFELACVDGSLTGPAKTFTKLRAETELSGNRVLYRIANRQPSYITDSQNHLNSIGIDVECITDRRR